MACLGLRAFGVETFFAGARFELVCQGVVDVSLGDRACGSACRLDGFVLAADVVVAFDAGRSSAPMLPALCDHVSSHDEQET
jgi:hypothetical protein